MSGLVYRWEGNAPIVVKDVCASCGIISQPLAHAIAADGVIVCHKCHEIVTVWDRARLEHAAKLRHHERAAQQSA